MTLQNLRARRQKIIEIAKRYHAANIRVFGSVSRGEATETSDIDFLVSFLPGASLLDQAR
ncbi:MAG: nucleotidyltransferase domain-containing protein [Gammaproteobacteria bacterium]|nr:nucleotidyltransferase domain-containing protein [Gammaproteobacteria bacterium]